MRLGWLFLLFILIPCSSYALESFQVERVRAFVAPDSSFSELEGFLGGAESSVYVNFYTITNPDAALVLEKASEEGVSVILMLEATPVGGIPASEARIVTKLSEAGVYVCFHSSNEFRFNHAKYLVVDNRSTLITTENLGNSGFPKEPSNGGRGWGVVVYDEKLAESLAGIFVSDLADCKKKNLSKTSRDRRIEAGTYEPEYLAVEYNGAYDLDLFTAPEEGIDPILQLLESAKESIIVEQAYIYEHWGSKKHDNPKISPNLFLEAVIDASRRGVKVRILLDSYWYNVLKDDPVSNLRTIGYVNRIAKEEGLDLEAKLMDLDELGLLKLHAKGVVVDGNSVLVSSINWNEHSPTKNRELGVIIYGEPAGYFAKVFECDWDPSSCRPKVYPSWIYFISVLVIPVAYVIKKKPWIREKSRENG